MGLLCHFFEIFFPKSGNMTRANEQFHIKGHILYQNKLPSHHTTPIGGQHSPTVFYTQLSFSFANP